MTPADLTDTEVAGKCADACKCADAAQAPAQPATAATEPAAATAIAPAAPCCCQPKPYRYGATPWVVGSVDSAAGPIPLVSTRLTARDRLGTMRVRLGIGRMRYRVPPGLYGVGAPTADSPVLVTANFKLTIDSLRRELAELDAWVLVLDTRGVNVWCAAGKGTFSTAEIIERVQKAQLEAVVSHRRLIVPQLGATGVAKHLVRKGCGFTVDYGPVLAANLPAFLVAGATATTQMRTVRFPLRERLKLIPVEASLLWGWKTIVGVLGFAFLAGLGGDHAFHAADYGLRVGILYGLVFMPVLGGSVLVPAALPVIPGRAFATKGALIGAVLAAGTVAGLRHAVPPLALAGVFLAIAAVSSYWAMTFTGSSTFTSPSGVAKEMRLALPLQLGAGLLASLLFIAQFVLRLVGVEL
jgi:hypothetical protein